MPEQVEDGTHLYQSPEIQTFDLATIRKDFPIFETGIAYLDSANTSQRPRQVTGAMLLLPAPC